DQFDVVQVVQVHRLQVDPGGADLGVAADPVHDLSGGAGQATLAQLVRVLADRVGPAAYLGLVPTAAQRQRVGQPQRLGVPIDALAGGAHPLEQLPAAVHRLERQVELVRELRGQRGG